MTLRALWRCVVRLTGPKVARTAYRTPGESWRALGEAEASMVRRARRREQVDDVIRREKGFHWFHPGTRVCPCGMSLKDWQVLWTRYQRRVAVCPYRKSPGREPRP